MKRKIGLSLMVVSLMVISTFTIIPASVSASCPSLVVTKKVWNGEEWVSSLDDVVKGDKILFNITVTFYNHNSQCPNNFAKDIVVEDSWPEGLEYKSTISPREPDEIVNNTIVWNFTGDPDYYLYNGESLSIVFETVADDYGEFKNEVEVTAIDFCTGKPISNGAYAWVYVEPRLDVEKKVWDPDEQKWVETLDGVIKDVDVHFQITITYHGPGYVTCMEVKDSFEEDCECLEYLGNEEFIYPKGPNDPLFNGPEITFGEDWVTYTWNSELEILFNLKDAESVIIRFDANVTDYCYGEDNKATNEVKACAWNCEDCCESEVCGGDTAEVICRPHDPVFEKTVLNGNEWAEETHTYVGGTVSFKLELTYYGNYNLTDIEIVDHLPEDILEYIPSIIIGPSTIPIKYGEKVSEDGKTVSWDIEGVLNDGETLTIEFKAKVIGSTGDCEICCGINKAEFIASESVTGDPKSGEDDAKVIAGDEINIHISVNPFGWTSVHAKIYNIGDEDFKDVEWTIEVKGGVLKRINVSASGTIDLPGNSVVTVSLPWRSILHKFGRITGKVTVTVPGLDPIEKEFKGFVFGRIILVRPLIRLGL